MGGAMASTTTSELYEDYQRRLGDRAGLDACLAQTYQPDRVLYPGCYLDLGPSPVFASVVYVDTDRRAARFFADHTGVQRLITARRPDHQPVQLAFHHADYASDFGEPAASFDLLISLYAGFVSQACKHLLRAGGLLLANNSHGDASMASIDPDYQLVAAVTHYYHHRYRLDPGDLDRYFIPKRPVQVTRELLTATGRGIGYTTSPAAYVFQRPP
jgi:hypothetical protein